MIKVNKGKVNINGEEAIVVAEMMVLLKNFITGVLFLDGSPKENAREKLNKMIDAVFEEIKE